MDEKIGLQRNLDGEKYLDSDWSENFDSRNDAVDYFQKLNLYADLLNVSKEQKEEFIHTKAYDELSSEDIESWTNHFGSISEAVSYAENWLQNNDFEKGEKGDWDLKVENVVEWAIDGKFSQRNTEEPSGLVMEETRYGDGSFALYESEEERTAEEHDPPILWKGPLLQAEDQTR